MQDSATLRIYGNRNQALTQPASIESRKGKTRLARLINCLWETICPKNDDHNKECPKFSIKCQKIGM